MDKKPLIVKWLAVGIILLFVGTCIIPAIAQDTEKPLPVSRDNTLYVGGSGPGNYTKIQDAIDNASDGDTIYVFPGIYKELIEIQNSIHLLGSDLLTTIINGQGTNTDIVTCVGINAVISGFTVYNCSMNHSCIIINHTANCTLCGNIIHTGGNGVTVRYAQNISIINNTFFHNLTTNAGYIGINIDNCFFITLSKNRISSWDGGIFIQGTHIQISQNNITNTHRGITDALNSLPQTNRHLIINNNHMNNNKEGIHLTGSRDYSIMNNEITNSTIVGIYLAEDVFVSVYPENITIKENIITRSAQGIVSENSINMTIEGNHIQHNTLGLLLIYDSFTSVKRNTFQDNNKTVVFLWSFFPLSRIHYKVPQFYMNYWNHSQKSPHPVVGRWGILQPCLFFNPINILPWVTYDWHPMEEPYDVPAING
jgi:nitrous oxidase accessory protein